MNPPIPMVVWLARDREEELRTAVAQESAAPVARRAPHRTLATLLLRLRLQHQS